MPSDRKQISISEQDSKHPQESLGVSTDTIVQDLENQAQQSLNDARIMADDFIARAQNENIVYVETEEEIKEMQALKGAIKKLNDDFVGRLLKIILRPVESFRQYQKSKRRKLLKTPDNLGEVEKSQGISEKSAVPADNSVEMVLEDKDLPLVNIDQNIVDEEIKISDWEKFLIDKSKIVVDKLQQFSESEQNFVISTWDKKPEIKMVLTESENPLEQIRVLMDFPTVVFNKNSDLNFLATIAKKFDASARQTLLEKISPCFDTARKDKAEINWSTVYGILVLASFPEVKKEQIEALPFKKIQALTATIIAYGEEVIQKLWTEENAEGFNKNVWGRDDLKNVEELIDFAKDLSPTLKRHLPIKSSGDYGSGETKSGQTIWSKGGLRGPIYFLDNFFETVNRIPNDLREPFFAALKPQEGEYSWYSKDNINFFDDVLKNFIIYSQDCHDDGKLNFDDFIHNISYFSPEHFPEVKRGFDFFKSSGLEHKVRNKFRIYKLAGGSEGEVGNSLVQNLVTKNDTFSNFKQEERRESSLEYLYDFCKFCKNELSVDTELCLKFLDFSEMDNKIILAFLSGELSNPEINYSDISIIESEIEKMGSNFSDERKKNINLINIFPNFKKLDHQQKEDFVYLINLGLCKIYDLSPIFSVVERGSVKQIKEFLVSVGNDFNIKNISVATLEKMATRPECGGLFNFVSKESTADKMIELYDAGLPLTYAIKNHYSVTRNDIDEFSQMLLKWDTVKLVEVAKQAKLIDSKIPLYAIVLFDHPEYEIQDIILCIRFHLAKYGNVTTGFFSETTDEESLKIFESRIEEVKEIFGDSIKRNQFEWRSILNSLSPAIWDKLKTKTVWLKSCLENGIGSRDIINLSEEILDEPLFWVIDWDENNEDTLRQLMGKAKNLPLAGFDPSLLNKNYQNNYSSVSTVIQSVPWLFTLDNLNILKKFGINESEFNYLKDITLDEFEMIKDYADSLKIDKNFYWWLNELRGNTLIPLAELKKIQKFTSGKITWTILKIIQDQRSLGETIEDTLNRLETNVEIEEDNVWNEGNNKLLKEWQVQNILKEMNEQIPEFVRWVSQSNLPLKFYKQISKQPVEVLKNLDRIAVASFKSYLPFDIEYSENLLSLIEHPNFQTTLLLLNGDRFDFKTIYELSPEKMTSFLNQLTPEMIKQFLEISSVVILNSCDIVDFFVDPMLAKKIIEFSKNLRTIFGSELKDMKLSVYDLLIMDFDTDLRNLQELQATCFNSITFDLIKALIEVSEGSKLVTLQKVLLLFKNGRQTIDFSLATEQLEKLPKGLRLDVMKEIGVTNFGWGILHYRDEMKKLGLGESEINYLIINLYKYRRLEIKELDYTTAKILFDDKGLYKDKNLISDIIKKYSGDVSVFILEKLNQKPVDQMRSIIIFENLLNAKVLDFKYYDAVVEAVNSLEYSVKTSNEFSESYTKILSFFALKTSNNELKDNRLEEIEITDKNWLPLFLAFISLDGNINLKSEEKEKIQALFKNDKTKDFCLNAIQQLWNDYLQTDKPNNIPFKLSMIAEQINKYGVGPLSQLAALGKFIHTLSQRIIYKKTTPENLQKIVAGEKVVGERFKKGRWNQEDQSGFYQTSSDILVADIGLYVDFLDLFENFNQTQFKLFLREIYPLYRAQLALLEKQDKFSPDDLNNLKNGIKEFGNDFKERGVDAFTEKKSILITEIKTIFKEKFGIIKVPENFSEYTRTLENFSVYLGNFAGRTADKETILGFYLALMLDNKWDNFRRGEDIDPDIYLIPEKSVSVKELLAKRKKLTPITVENLGINDEEMSRFRTILQYETQNVVLAEVETIDIKLTNVLNNLQTLGDLDLYPDQMDKTRLSILLKYGNKRVGGVVAKLYLDQKNPDKPMQFKEDELMIVEELKQILEDNNLVLSPEVIKQHFQDAMKPFSSVVNILSFASESGATHEVEKIQNLLIPTPEIIAIFNRFGEEFQVASGAIAVAQDLNYLDNLIVKHEADLTLEEKSLLVDYVKQIREQLVKLDVIYEQVKNKFAPLKQSSHEGSNQLLKSKLLEIDRIINSQTAARTVTSTATNNLNSIIENIRECLSCKNAGCNNDTNLSFGDENKFFVYSQTDEKKEGSIADQIIFVEPVTYEDSSSGLAFVFDRVYGTNTPDLFVNHIKTIYKKYRQLKDAFPNSNISMVIPDSIISTGGVSVERLEERLSTSVGKKIEIEHGAVDINVAESATGDHYIEFGGIARQAGKRQISGVILRIN